MGIINTASFAKLLWPGLNKVYQTSYKEYTPEWPEIFSKNTSSKAFEEEVGMTGFGLAVIKPEGGGITYDDQSQGFISRYVHAVVGLGFIITREMYEDNQYAEVGLRKAQALAFSMRQTKEIICANVLNRAFNSSYTFGDGKELCAADHPNKSGGTWANELAVSADLSEASLEQACIDIAGFTTDRGLKIAIKPKKLIIPTALQFEAARILKSIQQYDTANNSINALKSTGSIPDYSINHYLTDSDAWFILTDCPDGLKLFERRAMSFDTDNDFDTENARFKSSERFSVGATDPRAIFGSPGA